MIPQERDETMIVTLTVGQLTETISKIVAEQVGVVKEEIIAAMYDTDGRKRSADTVVGTRNIANAIGCNANTLYKLMDENPKLSAAVKRVGRKRVASRSELMAAIN